MEFRMKMELERIKHEHQRQLDGRKLEHQMRTDLLTADPTGAAAAHQQVLESGLTPLLEALHKSLTAPLEIHRDPVTGRAIGASRRVD